jgi:hypothetical protein
MSRNCFCFFVTRNGEDVVPIAKLQYIITVMPIVLFKNYIDVEGRLSLCGASAYARGAPHSSHRESMFR